MKSQAGNNIWEREKKIIELMTFSSSESANAIM